MRRLAARLGLAALALAALFGLWVWRIHVENRLRPFVTSLHPRALIFVVGLVLFAAALAVTLFVLGFVVVRLWKAADLG